MQTSPKRKVKHALAFLFLVVIISLNLEHIAKQTDNPLSAGWTIQANESGVGYSTSGQNNIMQQFGVVQQHGQCHRPQLLITLASRTDNFERFLGQTITLHITLGNNSGLIEIPITDIVQINADTQLALLSNFYLNERWLNDLSEQKSLAIEILSPADFSNSILQSSEQFQLSGYNAMSSLARLRCLSDDMKTANNYRKLHSIFTDMIFLTS